MKSKDRSDYSNAACYGQTIHQLQQLAHNGIEGGNWHIGWILWIIHFANVKLNSDAADTFKTNISSGGKISSGGVSNVCEPLVQERGQITRRFRVLEFRSE